MNGDRTLEPAPTRFSDVAVQAPGDHCLPEDLHLKRHDRPKVNEGLGTDEYEQSAAEPPGAKEADRGGLSQVDVSKDGLPRGPDRHSFDDALDKYQPTLSFSKGGAHSVDLEHAGKLLKDLRYFLTHDPEGLSAAFCWATDVKVPKVSHIYRLEDCGKVMLHLTFTFNHSDPNVGPRTRALGYEFFFPRLELRRLPPSGDESTATTVYYDGREALNAARAANELSVLVTQLKDGVNNENACGFARPPTRPMNGGPSDFSVLQSTSSQATVGPDQVNSAVESATCALTDRLSKAQFDDAQQRAYSPDAVGYQPYSGSSINPREPLQCPPSYDVSSVGQGIRTLVVYSPPSNSTGSTATLTTNDDGWPENQVVHLTESKPTPEYIETFSKELSGRLKQGNINEGYCWHCRYISRRPVEKCVLKNLRPWSLQRHLLSHFKLHKFFCPEAGCKKGTVTKQQLEKHIENKHTRTRKATSTAAPGPRT